MLTKGTPSSDHAWPRSTLNPKYRWMKDEFLYKGNQWVSWTTEQNIRRFEDQFEFLPNDILLSGYAKSGNTFLSEMVSLLVSSQGKKSRWENTLTWVQSHPVYARVAFIEENMKHNYPGMSTVQNPMDYLELWPTTEQMQHCRIIKTHLPVDSVLCATRRIAHPPRIIYVYRNPKDTCVSMFHFYQGSIEYGPFAGDWDEFCSMWLDGWIAGGDWRHVVPDWLRYAHTAQPITPILLLSYETLVREPLACVEKLFEFLYPNEPGASLDPEVAAAIVDHTSFKKMRVNPQTNYAGVEGFVPDFQFMRRGRIGDWKNWFTSEQNKQFDRLYEKCVTEVNELLSPNKLIFE